MKVIGGNDRLKEIETEEDQAWFDSFLTEIEELAYDIDHWDELEESFRKQFQDEENQ